MIRWRAVNDKKGYEQVVPMSDAVKQALSAARKAQKAIGNTPVFPAPKNPATPCSREMMDKWLRRAFQLAELAPPPHGLWHSIRRKWATERKGYPVGDVAAAGETHTETHTTGTGGEKAPQRNPLRGLVFNESGRVDLNHRPPGPEPGALTGLRYAPNG